MVEVELISDNPWIVRGFAARLTRESGSYREILERSRKEGIEKNKNYIRKLYEKYGHDISLEFGDRATVVNGVSRISALYLWRNINALSQVYISGLERSLRILQPPFDCIDSSSRRLYEMGLDVYQRAVEMEVPTEDARYCLPEGVLTTIVFNCPKGTERYLAKVANACNWPLEEHKELKEQFKKILEEELEFLPSEMPLSEWKFAGGEIESKDKISLDKNPFSSSINMALDASLSMYAQLVRMRLSLTEIESLDNAVMGTRYEIPPTFNDEIESDYRELAAKATEIQKKHLLQNDPHYVYCTLLGQKARSLYNVNGANAVHVAKERSCGSAQWEIRNKVGLRLAELLSVGPKCMMERKCTEPPKKPPEKPCPIKKEWPRLSMNEAMEKLRVPLRHFAVEE